MTYEPWSILKLSLSKIIAMGKLRILNILQVSREPNAPFGKYCHSSHSRQSFIFAENELPSWIKGIRLGQTGKSIPPFIYIM